MKRLPEILGFPETSVLPCLGPLYQNLWLLQVSTLEASVIEGRGLRAHQISLETLVRNLDLKGVLYMTL